MCVCVVSMGSVRKLKVTLPSVVECVVTDCQSLGRSPVLHLNTRVLKNMDRFTTHQICVVLNGLGRNFDAQELEKTSPRTRQLVYQLVSRLDADRMSLRDFSLVVDCLSKCGIRNEFFFNLNSNRILRKIKNTKDISGIIIILGAYTKLGLIGDGSLVSGIMKELVGASMKSTEAVNVLVSIGRLCKLGSFQIVPKNLVLESFVEPVHAGSALAALATHNDTSSDTITSLVVKYISVLPELSEFHLIQGFYAMSVLGCCRENLLTVFAHITTHIQNEPLTSSSVTTLLLSAMNKTCETLRVGIFPVLNKIDHTILGIRGICVYLNLLSSINLLPREDVVERAVELCSKEPLPQSIALLVNAFSKLDQNDSITQILETNNPKKHVHKMTPHGKDMCILGISNLLDLTPESDNSLLDAWLSELVESKRLDVKDKSPQSVSQLRIAEAIWQYSPNTFLRGIPKLNTTSTAPTIVGKVSEFHQQVIDALSTHTKYINAVDPITQYEIDILLHSIR